MLRIAAKNVLLLNNMHSENSVGIQNNILAGGVVMRKKFAVLIVIAGLPLFLQAQSSSKLTTPGTDPKNGICNQSAGVFLLAPQDEQNVATETEYRVDDAQELGSPVSDTGGDTPLSAKSTYTSVDKTRKPTEVRLVLCGITGENALAYQKVLSRSNAIFGALQLQYVEDEVTTFKGFIDSSIDDLKAQLAKKENIALIGSSGNRVDLCRIQDAERQIERVEATNQLTVQKLNIENIFPSQLNYYAYNPFAEVSIENSAKAELVNIRVSLFIPGYMNIPSEVVFPKMDTGTSHLFKLSATFDSKRIYSQRSNTITDANVEIRYEYMGQPEKRVFTKPIMVYGRNTINWKRAESIASFVTSLDESVGSFAGFLTTAVSDPRLADARIPLQVLKAMAIWDGIRALGFKYEESAWKISEQEILDDAAFPLETLSARAGSCTDVSVLIAACLENMGIRTQFVLTGDHAFLIFETGVSPNNGYLVSLEKYDYVVKDGAVWLPIDPTIEDKSMFAAWKRGAERYRDGVGGKGGLNIVDIGVARQLFPPVSIIAETPSIVPPSTQRVIDLVGNDLDDFSTNQRSVAESKSRQLAAEGTVESRNRAAIIQAKVGNYDAAIQYLGEAATANAYNTLGNICLLTNKIVEAQEYYQKSLQLSSEDGGVYLNFGLARYLAGSADDASEAFQIALTKYDSRDSAFEVLGLQMVNQEIAIRGSGPEERKISKGALFDLLYKSLRNIPVRQHTQSQADRVRQKYRNEQNRFVFAGRRSADPTQIADVREFLYWRE